MSEKSSTEVERSDKGMVLDRSDESAKWECVRYMYRCGHTAHGRHDHLPNDCPECTDAEVPN